MPPKDLPQPSPKDTGLSGQPESGTKEGEIARPPLFVEAFGGQALRQLTSEELGEPDAEVVTTPEGFNIGGMNESSRIRALTSLNETPRVVLDRRMRSGMTAFLSEDESLFEVMADDNDAVLRMGLTHQQLADFLSYFRRAAKYAEEQTGQIPQLIQFNGRTYRYGRTSGRQTVGLSSPFDPEDFGVQNELIKCLDDGSEIYQSELMSTLIRKYGFYGGREVGGIGPTEIAELAGFVPRTEKSTVPPAAKPKRRKAPDPWTRMQEDQEIKAWQERVRLVDLAKKHGVQTATQADMNALIGSLRRTLEQPLRDYRPNELEAMKRLGINPKLIPFAFKGTSPYNLELFEIVSKLYNGQAEKTRVDDGMPEDPTLTQLIEWRRRSKMDQ